MAEKTPDERIYTIPLRDAYKAPRTYRARKAMKYLKDYLEKHLKTGEFLIGPGLNHEVWSRGIKKPPRKVKVTVTKDGEKFRAELFGYKPKEKPKKDKKEKKKKLTEKAKERVKEARSGKAPKKEPEQKEEKKEPEKKEEKKEEPEKPKETGKEDKNE